MANEKTTFADAFAMADQVLYSGVACITDLMVKEGLINLDFADVRSVMREMGKAMMGTGEASGEKRALRAAEAAIANPLLDDVSMKGARGLLISITGGSDLTLYEVDEAATRIREEVDQDANIIVGATFDESLEGIIRVSVVATGIDHVAITRPCRRPRAASPSSTQKLRADTQRIASHEPRRARRRRSRRSSSRVRRRAAPRAVGRAGRDRGGGRGSCASAGRRRRSGRSRRSRRCSWSRCMAEPAPQDDADGRSSRRSPSGRHAPPRMPRIDELPCRPRTRSAPSAARPTEPRSGEAAHVAAAAPRLGRPRPPRRERGRSRSRRPQRPHGRALPPLPQPPCRVRMRRSGLGYANGRAAPPRRVSICTAGRLPVHKPVEDDQLEIPAFLRRQAN